MCGDCHGSAADRCLFECGYCLPLLFGYGILIYTHTHTTCFVKALKVIGETMDEGFKTLAAQIARRKVAVTTSQATLTDRTSQAVEGMNDTVSDLTQVGPMQLFEGKERGRESERERSSAGSLTWAYLQRS